jgi:hypothetical protein
MNTTLVTAGVAALIIAVVGGGASVFGATVPVIPTLRRQVALGLVGVAFIVAAVLLRTDYGGGTNKDVQAYRQRVLAACRDIAQPAGLPPINDDGTVDRDPYLEWVRTRLATSEGILNALWQRPVPDQLKDEHATARDDARALVKKAKAGLNQLERALPTRFAVVPDPPAVQQFNAGLAAPNDRLNGSMSELAGHPCTGQTAGSG